MMSAMTGVSRLPESTVFNELTFDQPPGGSISGERRWRGIGRQLHMDVETKAMA